MPKYYNTVPGWMDYQNIFDQAVDHVSDGDIMVEVGSFMGKSACYMLEKLEERGKDVSFHCIDLFKITPDDGDGEMPWGENAQEWKARVGGDKLLEEFLSNIEKCPTEISISGYTAGDSAESASLFEDGSCSFVWIDASHLYENTKKDIDAWFPKMKDGGIFAGHDYHRGNGVQEAVDEFCQKHNLKIHENRSSWVIYL